ncbi:cytoskeleton-associated protein 2-like [Dasypus novemcinctus]|uniref:cytoskeleton-associated protein 2-like n=1 Tax=Dasypus novemcinctus TaxID=9361 RepID=UPI00265F2E35|nr:cytoskeleton-associated protein 2-like [Dasypus novemcinctus]
MVRPGAAGAVEERQRKLQEYLAAKGKLKCHNTKPYLKAKNNCPNPAPSKSNIKPKKYVSNHIALPVKATRPISIKLQPRPAHITGPQKPKLDPPKLLGKRLTSGCVSSDPSCNQQQHENRSSTLELSGKLVGPLNVQESKTTKQQVADQGNAKCIGSVGNIRVGNESLGSLLTEINKENLPQTLSDSKKKPDPELSTVSKPKARSYNPAESSLAPKQVLGKSSMNSAILKDRVNKQFSGKTQIRILPEKSQQLSRGADLARPGEKPRRTVPSSFVQSLGRTQASQKPVAKGQDVKVNWGNRERPRDTEGQSRTVPEQKAKPTKPSTHPSLLQGGNDDAHPHVNQAQRSTQPCFRPRTSGVLQKSGAISQRPRWPVGTPSIRANGAKGSTANNGLQQNAQTLDPRLKKGVPQSHFLNRAAPKTQASVTTVNKRRVSDETQTHPAIKKKATAENRRKQLQEWQKSKGKIYKRPPMELEAKRKVIEKMNSSFWKSIQQEEEEKKAQLELSSKIHSTLTGCLQLIEEGIFSNEVFTILSSIPEAEKFAKFWICKAKLLARKGTFDVIGLYEEAIRNGATPIQELREVVLNILQDPNRTTEVAETNTTSVEELAERRESGKSCLCPNEREQVTATPRVTKAEQDGHAGIKFQVAPVPRINGMPEVQDMKLITPVRRSARIERAASRYPEMLQEHDLVVASLDELLEMEEAECFIVRKNEALPVTFQILELLDA